MIALTLMSVGLSAYALAAAIDLRMATTSLLPSWIVSTNPSNKDLCSSSPSKNSMKGRPYEQTQYGALKSQIRVAEGHHEDDLQA